MSEQEKFYNLIEQIRFPKQYKEIYLWIIKKFNCVDYGGFDSALQISIIVLHNKEDTEEAREIWEDCRFTEKQLKDAKTFLRAVEKKLRS